MAYKEGDIVKLKSSLNLNVYYGDNSISLYMTNFVGSNVTINKVTNSVRDNNNYLILEDNMKNWWTEEMIEKISTVKDSKKIKTCYKLFEELKKRNPKYALFLGKHFNYYTFLKDILPKSFVKYFKYLYEDSKIIGVLDYLTEQDMNFIKDLKNTRMAIKDVYP